MHKRSIFPQLIVLAIFVCFTSCKQKYSGLLPNPQIKMGVARLSGKIVNYTAEEDGIEPVVRLIYPRPISADFNFFSTTIREDGSFYFECPMECDIAIGNISSELFNKVVGVGLTEGELSSVEITLHGKDSLHSVVDSEWMNISYDVFLDAYFRMHLPDTTMDITAKRKIPNPEKYAGEMDANLKRRLSWVENDTLIPENEKRMALRGLKMLTLNHDLLNYRDVMCNFVGNQIEGYVPEEPPVSYYSFLKDFDLNNPQCLYQYEYILSLVSLLSIKALGLTDIGDMPIDKWQRHVKAVLSGLTGLNKGQFYELLTTYAYMKQFNEEVRPLSAQQEQNIKTHRFKNKDIAKILLAKNEKVIEWAKKKSPVVFRETPAVPNEDLMKTILDNYKGKVVVVDFWATWCQPCLSAIKETRDIKNDMPNEDVVFVYIAGGSSPQEMWKKHAETIGGEHYYLTEEQWDYLLSKFFFQGIPSYLYYDRDGKLGSRVEGMSNSGKMRRLIERLL